MLERSDGKRMKKLILIPFLCLLFSCVHNEQPPCDVVTNDSMNVRMDSMEVKVNSFLAKKQATIISGMVVIPVVFHVLYNQPVQNISDAQLMSQIDVLNKDYSATNTDITSVPAAFKPLIGNAGFQFVLAKRTPDGKPMLPNGIIRKATAVTSFSSDGSVCLSSMGGDDAWNTSQYLNIWVCQKSGAAGYSAYPWSGNPQTDGIIMGYNYVGTVGVFTNNWSYLLGRTLTHEVGHWFGLVHIFGIGNCTDDLVADTPIMTGSSGGGLCHSFTPDCANSPNGSIVNDYMDYDNDGCRFFFTQGQCTRMRGYLNTARIGLLTSSGATSPCP
jgi:hypothetical protein